MARPIRRGIGARPLHVAAVGTATAALEEILPNRSTELPAAFARGDILDDAGRALRATDPVRAGQRLWTFDAVPDEPATPIHLDVVAATDRWIVVDKPHGLASMPRGSHVARTVTVAARRQFGNDDVVPAHRLDALTSGLMLLTLAPQWRRPYQQLFEMQRVSKTYRAVVDTTGAQWRERLDLHREQVSGEPVFEPGPGGGRIRVSLCLAKPRGSLQTLVLAGPRDAPNATTDIEVVHLGEGHGMLRLHPRTGKTHQLRATCAHLGLPIVGDPLYPQVHAGLSLEGGAGSGTALQLQAQALQFVDPVDGHRVDVRSNQSLALWHTS